ncbi:MAG: formylglycine-generating enzyme family protein [Armatimonadota bacterium]|nr:formylglycine-generating enzyme family protein [Armatimonadota bacterium]
MKTAFFSSCLTVFLLPVVCAGVFSRPLQADEIAQNDPLAVKTPERMVYVPAGPFLMGTDREDSTGPNVPRFNNDARPQHIVNVAAFYMDKTEVTNAQYKRYCEATGYPPPPHWHDGNYAEGEADFPVTRVNCWEAVAYAAWAGKRLPTEAEWEKAARGTDRRNYPWGNDWNPAVVVADGQAPLPVGSRPEGASPYGALDLAGNVFEWTDSWYQAYPGSPHNFREFGTIYKVVRGGGFFGNRSDCQTHYRSVARPQTRSEGLGFRCVKDAK